MEYNNDQCIDGITCDVNNCTYNKGHKCIAESVQIGPQFAVSSSDTVCSTFKSH